MPTIPSSLDWRHAVPHRGFASRDECSRFVDLARRLAHARGELKPGYICGLIGVPALVFEDSLVQISAARTGPALEIVLKYPEDSLTNPVVMVTEKGEIIRVHGEHCYVVPHVEQVAAKAGLTSSAG